MRTTYLRSWRQLSCRKSRRRNYTVPSRVPCISLKVAPHCATPSCKNASKNVISRGRGEHERLAARDDDRFLEVSGERAIVRAQRPAVGFLDDAARTLGDERLDRQHEALREHVALPRIVV